jgi:hypothetical protein
MQAIYQAARFRFGKNHEKPLGPFNPPGIDFTIDFHMKGVVIKKHHSAESLIGCCSRQLGRGRPDGSGIARSLPLPYLFGVLLAMQQDVTPLFISVLKRAIVLRPCVLNHWSGIIRLNRPTRNVPPNPIRVEWLTI